MQQIDDIFLDELYHNMLPFQTAMTRYRSAIMEIETKFRVINEEYLLEHERNPIEEISSRLKSPRAIMKKAKKLGLTQDIETIEKNLNDIAGVRIICSFIEDIYILADHLLEQDDIVLIERKDYIKNPKPNGYRSLHLIIEVPIFLRNGKTFVRVEVQLRTIAMNFWATLDHKLKYKKNIPTEIENEISYGLTECADLIAMLDKRMEIIKNRIAEY